MWLDAVRAALDARTLPALVFFRDDDAGWDDTGLFAMLDVFAGVGVAVDLAAIPEAMHPGLASELDARRRAQPGLVGVHQHGFAHVNHERVGRKCEFGPTRAAAAQRADLARGRAMLADAVADVDPIFTPPWNRCTRDTAEILMALGLTTLSRDITATSLATGPLRSLDVAVDWCKLARGDAPERWDVLDARMAALVAQKAGPIGIMLHHAAMGPEDRARLRDLLALFAGHDRVTCRRMADFTARSPATAEPALC